MTNTTDRNKFTNCKQKIPTKQKVQTDQYSNRVIPFMKNIIEFQPVVWVYIEMGEDLSLIHI